MKNKIISRLTFFLVAIILFTACEKSPIEKAREAYDASKVVPKVLGVTGPTLVLQTFSYPFSVNYDRAGSIWTWTAVGATVSSVSEDKKTATVLFSTIPAKDTAYIKVTETTIGGKTSAESTYRVKVDPFCPLAVSGFVGTWGGTDGFSGDFYPSQVVTSAPSGTTIKVTGLNYGWIDGSWGETVTVGGTINMTVNPNGTLTIPNQFCFTTIYSGAPYDYWISGSGTWGNCGAKPAMVITYILENKTDGYKLPAAYYSAKNFTATLTKN